MFYKWLRYHRITYFKLDHTLQVVQPAPKTAKKESWVKSKEEIEAEEIATGAVATYQG